jgi:hypothetical protein
MVSNKPMKNRTGNMRWHARIFGLLFPRVPESYFAVAAAAGRFRRTSDEMEVAVLAL